MGDSVIRLLRAIVVVLVVGGLGYLLYTLRPHRDAGKTTLLVFCGAASKPAMEACAAAFEKQTGVSVHLQFGGSGTMLSRLKMSHRGDVYIPGSPDYMQKAKRHRIVDPDKVKILAYLVPSILVPKGNPKGIGCLEDLGKAEIKLGIGNPEVVCVGLYAVEVLETCGLFEQIEKNVVVHAESCSKTAALVAMNKVDAVLGWRVFSKWNPQAIEAVPIRPDRIPRLGYVPAGICTSSNKPELAEMFVRFLTSPEGRRIFAKWGYLAGEAEARQLAPQAEIGGRYRLPAKYRSNLPL